MFDEADGSFAGGVWYVAVRETASLAWEGPTFDEAEGIFAWDVWYVVVRETTTLGGPHVR